MRDTLQSYDEVQIPQEFLCLPRHSFEYDLVVIGSGPAGQKAAICAAKLGGRVALIQNNPEPGGVSLNTGTIPSKSFREAVVYLTGYRQRGFYGEKCRIKEQIQANDLVERTNKVIHHERLEQAENLRHNNVEIIVGVGSLESPHEVSVVMRGSGERKLLSAFRIILCTGTRPRRPADVPFDEVNIFDSDDVFGKDNRIRPLPDSVIVLGAGIIGIEYASMFIALGIPTILVDSRLDPLRFVDHEIAELFYEALRNEGAQLLFGDSHASIRKVEPELADHTAHVEVTLKSGKVITADSLLFALGRVPNVQNIGLEKVGVKLNERGNVQVDERFRTTVRSIYAAGDVIGFPSLASTSAEQGRQAALYSFGVPVRHEDLTLPYGIYTIPEMSLVGKTEEELNAEEIEYVVGTSLIWQTARGKILGEQYGALKLLFCKQTHKLLGVHIIGEGATELIHIGQTVLHFGGGIEYLCDAVFNYPTLAECYKVAAFNAMNRLAGTAHSTEPLRDQLAKELRTST
jgi:NAD(P) transhydrogenase